ncbi:MAG TPA: FeoB-associated Cys-rich membrane protein [Clostridia bacterium]|nr:FeoB-associated Cys-rich membrane protein [Clostridia bacterium]
MQFIVIICIVVALLSGLFIFALISKNKDPMMQRGCHGDCSHCASHCDEEDKNHRE